jgi:hypothetical protein
MPETSTQTAHEVRRQRARGHRGFVCAVGSVALASACAQRSASYEITAPRVVENSSIDFQRSSTTAERFGLDAQRRSAQPAASSSGLRWTTPPGWIEKSATSLRAANFKLADDERAECYLTLLSGEAGGLAANVNRWRTQMSLGAMSAEELEHLPRHSMLGRDAVLVDFTGTWMGMSGGAAREHWRLLGLLLVDPDASAFLKLTGPDVVVAAQRDAFLALARSFRSVDSASSDRKDSASNDATSVSDAHGMTDTAAGFTFTSPAGWRRAPDRPARAFTLFAGAGEGLECYVTTLGGDAGGSLANVNRWRGQIGLSGITQVELAGLPTVKLIGRDAPLVECEGTKASLIAIASNGADRSVFVKMSGPRELVKEQRAAFLAFASSLSEARSP